MYFKLFTIFIVFCILSYLQFLFSASINIFTSLPTKLHIHYILSQLGLKKKLPSKSKNINPISITSILNSWNNQNHYISAKKIPQYFLSYITTNNFQKINISSQISKNPPQLFKNPKPQTKKFISNHPK